MKRLISFIGATLLAVMPACANIAEGVSGDCTWVIDDDGNLSISSESDDAVLGNWEGDAAPWRNYKEAITTVAFSAPVNAQTCTYMFNGCTNLSAVYLDNFYTNEVTDMSYMFANCSSLEVIEIGITISSLDEDIMMAKGMFNPYRDNFITDKVTNMAGMFEGCKSLRSFRLSNLSVRNVNDFRNMFAGCSALEYMDLSALTINKEAKVSEMFANCNKLMNVSNESIFPTEIADGTFISLPTRGVCSVELPLDCLEDYQAAIGWRHLFVTADDEMKANSSALTAINGITEADSSKEAVFSFAGERLSAPVKGLNIIDGKKVMVK